MDRLRRTEIRRGTGVRVMANVDKNAPTRYEAYFESITKASETMFGKREVHHVNRYLETDKEGSLLDTSNVLINLGLTAPSERRARLMT